MRMALKLEVKELMRSIFPAVDVVAVVEQERMS